MLKEKAGALAGQIWEALNGTEGLTQKQIKKAAKMMPKSSTNLPNVIATPTITTIKTKTYKKFHAKSKKS